MDFPLNREVIDQIIFAMEDQSTHSFIGRRTGMVMRDAAVTARRQGGDEEEYLPLPRWQPADGFRLMEGFVAQVPNPVYQERLRAALAAGRGVFRSFKDALKQSGDLERSWYRFKEEQMRAVVVEWYGSERELLGLERLGPEPEESPEAGEEFAVLTARPEHMDQVRELDRDALMEEGALASTEDAAYRELRVGEPTDEDALVLVAETAATEVAAMVWVRFRGGCWEVVQLAVRSPYRSVGLSARLLEELKHRAADAGADRIGVQLGRSQVPLVDYLRTLGFTEAAVRMEIGLA